MHPILSRIRHFLSPSLFLAATLLFVFAPVFEVSCNDQTNVYKGRELVSPNGPFGEQTQSASPFGDDEETIHRVKLENEARASLRLEIGIGLAAAAAGILTALLLVPRIQGLLAALLGFTGFWALFDSSRRVSTLLAEKSDILTFRILPAWTASIWILFLAGVLGLATAAWSFSKKGLAPIGTWSGIAAGLRVGLARIPWRMVGAAAFLALVSWGGVHWGGRWLKIHTQLEKTAKVAAGCLEVDSAWESDDTSNPQGIAKRNLCVKGFEIDRYEATFHTFRKAFPGKEPSPPCLGEDSTGKAICGGTGDDYPVSSVSLAEADSFCRSRGMRLPALQEWEYAARNGTTDENPFPDRVDSTRANLPRWGFHNQVFPVPVGSYPANDLGLHDMEGNVREWTSTCFDREGRPTTLEIALKSKFEDGIECTLAGGSWYTDLASNFWQGPQGMMNSDIGVRCAK